MYKYFILLFTIVFFNSCSYNIINPPDTNETSNDQISPPIELYNPIPSQEQLQWQNSETAMFIHFGINTFTGQEWGDGTENPLIFDPSGLNAEQWVNVAKENGFKYIILTAKHHDGFCLWPSKYTSYSIKNSPYKNGKGDIVKEFADACHKYNVQFGFYLSPWDRHEATYGTDEYNLYFQNQLIELLTQYGEVGEVWFDGANGEGPNGVTQVYNWDLFYSTVRYYQPKALIANMGPDIRWIGNETGLGSETEWCIQPRLYSIQNGSSDNKVWFPSECDVSIRPGWFYHEYEDTQIKSVSQLTDIFLRSVGRNSNLLLNVPVNKVGVISDYDVQRLKEYTQNLKQIFSNDLFYSQKIVCNNVRDSSAAYSPDNCLDNNRSTFWTTDKDVNTAELTITLSQKESLNAIWLEEAIEFGQRIKSFKIYYDHNGNMEEIYNGTTVGRSRIITFDTINTDKVVIVIEDSYASPTLRIVKGFYSDLL